MTTNQWTQTRPTKAGAYWLRRSLSNNYDGELCVLHYRSATLCDTKTGHAIYTMPSDFWWTPVEVKAPPIVTPIIFLDFDGVINFNGWDGEAIDALNRVKEGVPMVHIVVTSQWRTTRSVKELGGLLHAAGVRIPVRGATPLLPPLHDDETREQIRLREIKAWIALQPALDREFPLVVFDDLPVPDHCDPHFAERWCQVCDKIPIHSGHTTFATRKLKNN